MNLRDRRNSWYSMRRYIAGLSLLAAVFALTACPPEQYTLCRPEYASFDCNFQNGGKDAICIFDGEYGRMCAFPDADCDTGYRWSKYAYSLSGDCVAPERLTTTAEAGGDR
jgi:hypothetical protein